MTSREVRAVQMMRVWHIAKLSGQSPEQVMEWPAEDFMWAEAIEHHVAEEQAKALKRK